MVRPSMEYDAPARDQYKADAMIGPRDLRKINISYLLTYRMRYSNGYHARLGTTARPPTDYAPQYVVQYQPQPG